MSIEHITDHADRGVDLLITQYRELPRFEELLRVLLEEVQIAEDLAWKALTGRMVDTAVGVQLDTIGRIVGQPRVSDDDEKFRLYVKARIAVNSADGTPDDVQAVAELLLEGRPWEFRELYPATIIVDTEQLTEHADIIAGLIRLARSSGVAFSLHFSEEPSSESFTFAEGDGEEDDEALGLSGDDPDVAPGGLLIGAY